MSQIRGEGRCATGPCRVLRGRNRWMGTAMGKGSGKANRSGETASDQTEHWILGRQSRKDNEQDEAPKMIKC